MKKLFKLQSLLLISLFIVSCSSDENVNIRLLNCNPINVNLPDLYT